MARPGCRETCGNLTIPYPFGIGSGCYYQQGFDVSCEDNRTFLRNSSSQMEIYNISLLQGQVRVSTLIASKCYYDENRTTDGWSSARTGRFFTISSKANKFTAIGCYTLGYLGGYNKQRTGTGCLTMCLDKQGVDQSALCSGMGCCQTSIAPNLTSINITFDGGYSNSEVRDFNPCSYAFVAEQDWFKFNASYLEGNNFTDKFKYGVPSVFDWVAGNQSSVIALMASKGTPTWQMGAKVSNSWTWRSSGASILFAKSNGEGCGCEIRALRVPSPQWPYAARAPTAGSRHLSPPRAPVANLVAPCRSAMAAHGSMCGGLAAPCEIRVDMEFEFESCYSPILFGISYMDFLP